MKKNELNLNRFKLLCEYNFKVDKSINEDEEEDFDLGEFKDEVTNDTEGVESEEGDDINTQEGGGEEEIEISVDDGELEIDLSPISDKAEEALETSQSVKGGIDDLMAKFDELAGHLEKMDDINNKIDSLEQEFEKRNPTPVEKMELRSLNSFPYNQTLTSYWEDKEDYDVTPDNEEKEEYILTNDEIENYDKDEIKDSLDVK